MNPLMRFWQTLRGQPSARASSATLAEDSRATPDRPHIRTHRIQVGEEEIILTTVQMNGLQMPLVKPGDKAPKM
jgi:hypothetical protein